MKVLATFAFILLLSAVSSACIVYGGGVTYLNKPGISVNLSAITQSSATPGANYTYSEGVLRYRSHYNSSLLISLSQDEYGWVLRAGLPGESPYAQPEINWGAAIQEELEWLISKSVIKGATQEDVSYIATTLANNPGSYTYWSGSSWIAIQNNCFPTGDCVRCDPAGAGLNSTLPPYGLEVQDSGSSQGAGSCPAGFLLIALLPLAIALRS